MKHNPLRRQILTWLAVLPVSGRLLAKGSTVASVRQKGDEVAPTLLALNAVRFFNTLQGWHKSAAKTYLSRPELFAWKAFQMALRDAPKKGLSGLDNLPSPGGADSEALLPGWHFQMHVSPQRDDYLVVVRSGETIIASGDPGVIYHGEVSAETPLPQAYFPVRDLSRLGLRPLDQTGTIGRAAGGRASGIMRRVAFLTVGASYMRQTHCGGGCWGSPNAFCWNVGSADCTWCCFGQKDDCCYDSAVSGGMTGGCRCTGCNCSNLLD